MTEAGAFPPVALASRWTHLWADPVSRVMPLPSPTAEGRSESERSGVVGSPEPVCAACGGPRGPRKREACSDRCRAELSRRRRRDALRTRDDEIRALLETALKKLEEGAP